MAGRPRIELNGDEVRKLAKLGCTNGEIGDFFGVSDEHIRRNFVDELALGRADQKISLRRMQWKTARSGNCPMQIHLGKQYLGQSDKQTHELSGKSDAELVALFTALTGGVGPPGPGPVPDGSDEPLDTGPGAADASDEFGS